MFGYMPVRPWFDRPAGGFGPYPPAVAAPYGAAYAYPYVPYAPVWRPRFGRRFWGWGRGGGRGRGRGRGMWCAPFGWW